MDEENFVICCHSCLKGKRHVGSNKAFSDNGIIYLLLKSRINLGPSN